MKKVVSRIELDETPPGKVRFGLVLSGIMPQDLDEKEAAATAIMRVLDAAEKDLSPFGVQFTALALRAE